MQVVPDVIAMTACMDALAAGGKWSEAIKILDDMRSKGITPNERTYKVRLWGRRACIVVNLCCFDNSSGRETSVTGGWARAASDTC